MTDKLSRSARRFQKLLRDTGYTVEVVELPESTRTAPDAAAAIGCCTAQIAKSLVFRGDESGQALLAVVGGANQADAGKLAALAGEPLALADARFVRAQTGYAVGGVPPLGHPAPLRTFIDEDLLAFDRVWAAAGTPRAVCCLPASELATMTNGQTKDIKQ